MEEEKIHRVLSFYTKQGFLIQRSLLILSRKVLDVSGKLEFLFSRMRVQTLSVENLLIFFLIEIFFVLLYNNSCVTE